MTCKNKKDHFFWGVIYFRWIENISKVSQIFSVPSFLKLLAPLFVWRTRSRLEKQGIGRHSRAEIYEMAEDDLRTVSKLLGNKKFLGGEEPCEEDCAVFGSLAQVIWAMPGSSFEKLVNVELHNLKEYCERMKQLYWSDWENCLD